MCNKIVTKLMNPWPSEETNVNATVHHQFCDGVVKGFSATLNGDGLRWVRICM